jgi:hypothetical protein
VLALLLSGGGDDDLGAPAPHSSPPPTSGPKPAQPSKQHLVKPVPVRFHVVKLQAVPGRPRTKPPVVSRAAHRAARHVTHLLDRLYTLAYSRAAGHPHPPKWLLGFFAGGAQRKARHHLGALTIGPAGPGLAVLRPARAALWVRVLLDHHNQPFTAVASATFKARGRTRDGGKMIAHSWARFFLQPSKHGWSISAFEAKRRVVPVKA